MISAVTPKDEATVMGGHYRNNRYPLITKPYMELPIGAVKPDGWLKEQMCRMATGMTGHLDEIYEAVMGPRNGWLGGDGDVWERGPYWIDGLLPLAYILENKALIEKVQPWIEWTLASQKPNGYFGPDTDRPHEAGLQRDNSHDWWPKMVVLKVMQQYYSATGDEQLRFGDPIQGSELCTAVEMMFSLEKMLEITGDVQWADQIEKIAYNALPTQVTDDFTARQYYQQVNQIAITHQPRNFSTPYEGTDQLFGPLCGYPCCTANLHQGWPKFTKHLWMATEDYGIAALLYAPSQVTAKVANGIEVTLKEETNYPFEEEIRFEISFADKKMKQAFFPIHLRIPAWCRQPVIRVNEEVLPVETAGGEIARIARQWKSGDRITLELPMHIEVSRWYDGAGSVERGPLLYALKMEEIWEKRFFEEKDSRYGEWFYEVTSGSAWNYSLVRDYLRPGAIAEHFQIEKSDKVAGYPWTREDAPITIRTKARKIPRWQEYCGSVGTITYQPVRDITAEEEIIELIPYGCTTLRIAEFPIR
ncbi:glycoside hydrolase family 127 protein [Parabacteroides sp. OttesenSCG-928-N08]|nr:glycoside hydrolase family 127 protein [Parabacteroides sp. OttesenSCG-928-N08]